VTTLVELLRRLDRADVLLAVDGGRLKWSAPRQLAEEVRAEILQHRTELLELFRDPPTWPPSRGRSGPLVGWTHAAGDAVRLRDGREGILATFLYDTRTGHCRGRVMSRRRGSGRRGRGAPEHRAPAALDRRAGVTTPARIRVTTPSRGRTTHQGLSSPDLAPAVNEHEAARFLGLSVHTLRRWRREARGPAFEKHPGAVRRGRGQAGRVVYRAEALRHYLEKVTVPTDEPPMPALPVSARIR
jgi:hypothetical protein